ncbi:hypothetical protein Bealeia2_02056 (plasmid) [Candidatus Bealeia paramacronuclearis]|nr:hypothetical protein [Candidatus Bealeia paramacronuclearis]
MHKRDTFYGNDQDATNVIAFPNGDDFDDTSPHLMTSMFL